MATYDYAIKIKDSSGKWERNNFTGVFLYTKGHNRATVRAHYREYFNGKPEYRGWVFGIFEKERVKGSEWRLVKEKNNSEESL